MPSNAGIMIPILMTSNIKTEKTIRRENFIELEESEDVFEGILSLFVIESRKKH
jgi:hypothetical protein